LAGKSSRLHRCGKSYCCSTTRARCTTNTTRVVCTSRAISTNTTYTSCTTIATNYSYACRRV
jgi:hypothetical protein